MVMLSHTTRRASKIEMSLRCLWLLVCVAVCLLLHYPICSHQQDVAWALYIQDYPNDPDCNAHATLGNYFNNEAGKNITCPLLYPSMTGGTDPSMSSTDSCTHQPGSLPPNGSVEWCYTTSVDYTIIGAVTLCINATGHRDVSYSIEEDRLLTNHVQNITVLDDGCLRLPEISKSNRLLKFVKSINCTVLAGDGHECGMNVFTFTVFDRTKTKDEVPVIKSAPNATEGEGLHFGDRLVWCVSGGSLGVHDLRWAWSEDPHLETVNISAIVLNSSCLSCDCANSTYYNSPIVRGYLQNNMTVGGTRGVAFSVLGYEFDRDQQIAKSWQCSGVPNRFLSFVMIDGVKPSDDQTKLMFNVTSFTGDWTRENYSIHATPMFMQDSMQTPQGNDVHFCSASIPVDANLEWRTSNDTVTFLDTIRFSSRSKADTDHLCQESSHSGTFFIRFENSSLTDVNDATIYISQEIMLVLCNNHIPQTPTKYTCYSSNGSVEYEGPTVCFNPPTSMPPPSSTSHPVITIVVPIVTVVVIIHLLIILIMIIVMRYSRLKSEPARMCPVGSATASLLASTLAPFGLEPVPDNNSLEFPRENLQFVKVLGEGQFGRVFKATAEGICPYDSNRKIVAVKTLKENARPTDKDDLQSELATMRGMEPHPNILNYLGMCSETATEPLCILMEFALYGSLKDYLKSVKTGKLPNPQLLLHRQQQSVGKTPPIAPPPRIPTTNLSGSILEASWTSGVTSSVYPATNLQSMLNLCPYHHNQLTQHRHNGTTYNNVVSSSAPTGGAPGNQYHSHLCPAASVSLYNVDPASKAHAMRLLRLLNSKYYIQELADDHECCHDDTLSGATTNSGQLVCSYCGIGETCVRRACLDNYPYWYHGTIPRNDYYNYSHNYYNYSEQQKKDDSESPFAETSETNLLPQPPPIYVNTCEGEVGANSIGYPQQELMCHCESPPNLNPYYYYNLLGSSSSGCIYCSHQYTNVEAVGGGACQQTGTDQANLGGAGLNLTTSSTDNTEQTRLSYFEVLDFALQIARGMEHLEKMKCVHRDLAARNVLIAEGFLLKIGDFGLARDLSEKDYYRKITPGRVPARWMALESLDERTHNSKSDVWSYGVVLWEILTYGGLPYGKSPVASGIESLTAHIKAGHRLPKPPNCSKEMFGLLKMCWEEDPELRPSFAQLVDVFSTLLDSTKEYFSLSVEDAVHQPMTAHLEASAVAGISSSGPEREPPQPTILTSPYGTMGVPVLSTSCSYIDEPDSPTRDNDSVPMSPEPSSNFNLGPSLLDQVSAALGQDYLKLIDDSANHQEHSNEGAVPLFSTEVAGMGNGEPGTGMRFNQTTTTCAPCSNVYVEPTLGGMGDKKNEVMVVGYPPPYVVLESLPSISQSNMAGMNWSKEASSSEANINGRSRIKHGHLQTRRRNIHCLETEV